MMPYSLIDPTYSPSFKLAESIDSDEPMELSSSLSPSSESSINSNSLSSPSTNHLIDGNSILSSTVSHLFSTILPKTTPSSSSPTTESSSSSSFFSPTTIATPSTTSILLSTLTTPSLSTISPTDHHHHHHYHNYNPVTPPLISNLPTNGILDFGDKFLREEQRCVALVPETYDPVISGICGLAVTFGLIYILSGYRLFRSVLFLTGFLIVSSLTYGFIVSTSTPIPLYGTLIVSLSAGFLAGLVTLLVTWLGLMVLGFHLGTFIGILIITWIHLLSPHVDTLSPPQSIWITFSVIAGWGIIGAFSTLYFQKGCTILATCMFGSTLVIGGLDYFVENFNLFLWFWDNLKSNGNAMLMSTAYGIDSNSLPNNNTTDSGLFMCLISWILLMLWIILVCLGLFCQWCATGRGYYHSPSGTFTSSSSSRRNGNLDLVRIRAEESKTEQKQRKYRYLYQVRTAHGDVISQHYIQNFQKKLSPQLDHHNDSLRTYNSDLSHLTSYNQSESRTTTMSHLP